MGRLTAAETRYRGTVNHLAFAALVFLVILSVRETVLEFLSAFLPFLTERAFNTVYELLGGLLYAAMFCVPVLFFYKLPKTFERAELKLELHLPRDTMLYVFFGMSVVLAAAYANSMMLSVFQLFSADPYTTQAETQPVMENYELVLMLFTTAIVPAFTEELFFRGMVLENLRPYGRTTAIFGSALMFGLMHQNIQQIFYTVVAGIVIGWVYIRTESIWTCVLLHFVNNFSSVLSTALQARLPYETYMALAYMIDGLIFMLGITSGVILLLRERDHRADIRRLGAFEQTLVPSEEYAAIEVAPARRVKLFFSPAMIIYVVFCVLAMLGIMLSGFLL